MRHVRLAERVGDTLRVRFNRPQRHNAFSTDARGALLEALEVVSSTPSGDLCAPHRAHRGETCTNR